MSGSTIERDGDGKARKDEVPTLRGGLPEEDEGLAALRAVNESLPRHWWLPPDERLALNYQDVNQP